MTDDQEIDKNADGETDDPGSEEWNARTLCSDEACIGIIGPDGRCRECGKPYAGWQQSAPAPGPVAQETEYASEPAPPEEEENAPEEDSDWASRKLCSDESCIGTIGPDGRCKECGRPYDGS